MGLVAAVPVLVATMGGCAVSRTARGLPGTDLTEVRPGSTRTQVEAVLGSPVREWATASGARYRIYRYSAGLPGRTMSAAMYLLADMFTLGGYEWLDAAGHSVGRAEERALLAKNQRNLAVSYRSDEVVIGVFMDVTEFARLPDDGVNPAGAAADAAR